MICSRQLTAVSFCVSFQWLSEGGARVSSRLSSGLAFSLTLLESFFESLVRSLSCGVGFGSGFDSIDWIGFSVLGVTQDWKTSFPSSLEHSQTPPLTVIVKKDSEGPYYGVSGSDLSSHCLGHRSEDCGVWILGCSRIAKLHQTATTT